MDSRQVVANGRPFPILVANGRPMAQQFSTSSDDDEHFERDSASHDYGGVVAYGPLLDES